tara:strand:- start:81 stop:308 length:228 start_codon:yes stop_codon:yes gene_type:complete
MSPTSYQAAPPRIDYKIKTDVLLANDGTEVIDFLYFVKQSLAVTFCQTKSQPLLSRLQNKKAARNTKKVCEQLCL